MKSYIKKVIYKIIDKAYTFWVEERYQEYYKRYRLPNSFRFNGGFILIYGKGEFFGGERSYVGSYSTFQTTKGHKIVIGKNCRISHNVKFYTSSLSGDSDLSIENSEEKTGDIIVEDYAWIGANVFINPGVRIGTNSVVGANSVVTKDVPPYGIVGGVPAKLIRYKETKKV